MIKNQKNTWAYPITIEDPLDKQQQQQQNGSTIHCENDYESLEDEIRKQIQERERERRIRLSTTSSPTSSSSSSNSSGNSSPSGLIDGNHDSGTTATSPDSVAVFTIVG